VESVIVLEKLSDIRDRVDILRNCLGLFDLEYIYEDLTELMEEYE
jgi:hypothetical protein